MQPSNIPDATTMQELQNPRLPLRRATYIHVSDLTSAYNIDHKRLELELARVKNLVVSDSSPSVSASDIPVDEASLSSQPQKRLQPPRGGFNLCVLVGKVNVVVDKLRVDRSRVRLAEVEVGDETGTVSLRARDDQIDSLENVSERSGAVVLRNCTLELFQGKHIRLAVTKWGKLSVFPDNVASTPPPPSKMNRERNFSLIDLSLVASEMVENHPPEVGQTVANRESPIRGPQTRQPFHSPHYPQSQPQRRTSRDRRQTRAGRGIAINPRASPFAEASMQNRMMYPGVTGFGYGDPMEMQHYYATPRQSQESIHPSPHHYMQLQQQFEMHHRQMHQIQVYHEQTDPGRHLQMQSSHGSIPNVSGSRSFDLGPPDFPSLPVILPEHITDKPGEEGTSESERERTGSISTMSDLGVWGGQHRIEQEGENIPNSPGMNPTATVFAPSYGNPTGGPSMQGVQFLGYNPYEQQRGPYPHQQHPVYSQSIVYVPVLGTGTSHTVAPSDNAPNQRTEEKNSSSLQETLQNKKDHT